MWCDRTIFSEGDLCDLKRYAEFIEQEYHGDYAERLTEVNAMLTRLTAEKEQLKKMIRSDGNCNGNV